MKKITSKTLAFIVISALLASLFCVFAYADESEEAIPAIGVTVSSGSGVYTAVLDLKDADGDNALTINDALILFHDEMYEGGAAAGYGSAVSQYGLGMTKLWGIENGGSYGYYVNDQAAFSLEDPVKDGDYVYAFVYTDTVAFSDAYCFFDEKVVAAGPSEEVELTLSYYSYDENWNLVSNALKGAVITVNGEETDLVTDEEGKVKITYDNTEIIEVSAKSADVNIVPPVCFIYLDDTVGSVPDTSDSEPSKSAEASESAQPTATAAPSKPDTTPKTGDNGTIFVLVIVSLAALGAVVSLKKSFR